MYSNLLYKNSNNIKELRKRKYVKKYYQKHFSVDHAFLEKQYKILSLFEHVHQPMMMEEHMKICDNIHDPAKYLMENKEAFEVSYYLVSYIF